MGRRTRHCPTSRPACVKQARNGLDRIARTGSTGYGGALPLAGLSTIPPEFTHGQRRRFRPAQCMPLVPLAQMEKEITRDDLLIVNPSFSSHQFGWRLPGFKISYVQGFSTYALLDCRLDHYVAVSGFVAAFLRTVYAIDARVIPPFIDLGAVPPAPPWEQRPEAVVLPYRKGMQSSRARACWPVAARR